jgi:hypothetical protein
MARPYKLTDFDTLQDMATRFSVETAALQLGNRELQGLPVNANFPMSLVGTVIQLPVDDSGMPFDWQPYTSPGGEKLADICKNVLKDRRFVGSPTGAAFLCASLFFPPALRHRRRSRHRRDRLRSHCERRVVGRRERSVSPRARGLVAPRSGLVHVGEELRDHLGQLVFALVGDLHSERHDQED